MKPDDYHYDEHDPFFSLIGLALEGGSLSNEEIDEIVYNFPEVENVELNAPVS